MRIILKLSAVVIFACLLSCSENKSNPKISLYAESVQNGAMVSVGDTLLFSWMVDAGSSALSQFEIKEQATSLYSKNTFSSNPYNETFKYFVKTSGNHYITLYARNSQSLQDSLKILLIAQ